ncbi:uncharacterized protein [Musca autumnalis]|uniref:uncharacterized protein n=1 Tax=Musca autumnalis TaxID=221902 RepID=UPI003CF7626E
MQIQLRFLLFLLVRESWAVLNNLQEDVSSSRPHGYYLTSSNTLGSPQQNGYQYQRPQQENPKDLAFGMKLQPYEYNRAPQQNLVSMAQGNQAQTTTYPQQNNPVQNNRSNTRQELSNTSGSPQDATQQQMFPQQSKGQYQLPNYHQQRPENNPSTVNQGSSVVSSTQQGPASASSTPQRSPYSTNNPPNNQVIPYDQQKPSYAPQSPTRPQQVASNGYQYQGSLQQNSEAVIQNPLPNIPGPQYQQTLTNPSESLPQQGQEIQQSAKGPNFPQNGLTSEVNERSEQANVLSSRERPLPSQQESQPGTAYAPKQNNGYVYRQPEAYQNLQTSKQKFGSQADQRPTGPMTSQNNGYATQNQHNFPAQNPAQNNGYYYQPPQASTGLTNGQNNGLSEENDNRPNGQSPQQNQGYHYQGQQDLRQNSVNQHPAKIPDCHRNRQAETQQSSSALRQESLQQLYQRPAGSTTDQHQGYLPQNENNLIKQNPAPNRGYSYSQVAGNPAIAPQSNQEVQINQNRHQKAMQDTAPMRQESVERPAGPSTGQMENNFPMQNPTPNMGYSYSAAAPNQVRGQVPTQEPGFNQNLQPGTNQNPLQMKQKSEEPIEQRPVPENPFQMVQNPSVMRQESMEQTNPHPAQQNAGPSNGNNGPTGNQNGENQVNINGQNPQQHNGYPQAMRPNPEVTYQPQQAMKPQNPQPNGIQNMAQPSMDFFQQFGPQVPKEASSGPQQAMDFSQQIGPQIIKESPAVPQQPNGVIASNNVPGNPPTSPEIPKPSRKYLPPFSGNENQSQTTETPKTPAQNQVSSSSESPKSHEENRNEVTSTHETPKTPQQIQGTFTQQSSQNTTPQKQESQDQTTPNTSNYQGLSHKYLPSISSPQANETSLQPSYNTQPWNPITSDNNRTPKQQSLNLPQGYRYSTPSMKQTPEHVPMYNGVMYNELGMGMNTSSLENEIPKNATEVEVAKTEVETNQGYVYGRPETGFSEGNGVTLLKPVDTMPPNYIYYNNPQQLGQNGTENSAASNDFRNQGNGGNSSPNQPIGTSNEESTQQTSPSGANLSESSRPHQAAQLPLMPQLTSEAMQGGNTNENPNRGSLTPVTHIEESELRPHDSPIRDSTVQQPGGSDQNGEVTTNSEGLQNTNPSNGQNGYLNQQYPYQQVSALNQVNRFPEENQQSQYQNSGSTNNAMNTQRESSDFRPSNFQGYQQNAQQYIKDNTYLPPIESQFNTQSSFGTQNPPTSESQGSHENKIQAYFPPNESNIHIPVQQTIQVTETQTMSSVFRPSPEFLSNSYKYGSPQTNQMTLQNMPQMTASYQPPQSQGPEQVTPQNNFQPSYQNFQASSQTQPTLGQSAQPAIMDFPQNPGQMQGYSNQVPQQQLQIPTGNNMAFIPSNPAQMQGYSNQVPQQQLQIPSGNNMAFSPKNFPQMQFPNPTTEATVTQQPFPFESTISDATSSLETTTPNTVVSFFGTPNPIPNQETSAANAQRNSPMTFEETKTYMQMPSHSFELPTSYVMVATNGEQHLMPEPRTPNQTPSTLSEAETDNTQNPMVLMQAPTENQEPIRQPHLVYGPPDQAGPQTETVPQPENTQNSQNAMTFLESPIVYGSADQVVTPVTMEPLTQQPQLTMPHEEPSQNEMVFMENPRQPRLMYGSPVYEGQNFYLPPSPIMNAPYLKK